MKNIYKRIKEYFDNKKSQYVMYMYYKEQLIKKIKVEDKEEILYKKYPIKVLFKKHLFCANYVNIMVTPSKIKMKDSEHRKIYVDIILSGGVEINE